MIRTAAASVPLDEPRRFPTAEEYAYLHLRKAILAGTIRGGERLNQDEIAARLQLSRMPVRQAILRLEGDGLVVNRPNRGAVVTSLGPMAILELFEMRSVLEGLALRLAVPHLDAAAILEIERRTEDLAAAEPDVSVWVQRHDEFHDFLCQHARRRRLSAQIRHLRQQVTPLIRVYLSAYPAEMAGFEHRALVRSIRGGDPAAAEQAMREHIVSAAEWVMEFVRRNDHRQTEDAKE